MSAKEAHPSSFRDPSGFITVDNQIIKRVINPIYFRQYWDLTKSGFFESLFKNELLIPHKELDVSDEQIVIQPETVPFVTYPYEWSFNMYKEAALLTLKLQKYSLEHGFSLKDASAFNVTFHKGKAIFIDTLSFDFYKKNTPWRAFKQFIMHFLGPLVLAHYHGAQQLKLIGTFIEGIPLQTISSLLPFKTSFSPLLYTNIHLLAKSETKHSEDYKGETKSGELSLKGQLNIIKNLYDYIKKLELKEKSEWGNYYTKTNYTSRAFTAKSELINAWVDQLNAETLIDIGGNDGTFVRKLENHKKLTLVCDVDNNAVDHNYKTMKLGGEEFMLPFVLDVLNPSAGIGLNNKERASFLQRIKEFAPGVTLALAIIHHMSLSGNVPFGQSAAFFSKFSKYLIIEFPKRNDSWVQRLLKAKVEFESHFDFYAIENFEVAYSDYFRVMEKVPLVDSERVLFLMKNKC